jgi:coenzyme PQQ precursor peptide PqqA
VIGRHTHIYIENDAEASFQKIWRNLMKIWNKPQVNEQSVGLEVTSYMPAEIDII